MRKGRIALFLSVLALVLTFSALPGTAADVLVLKPAPGVAEKLEALGPELSLDWGVYKNT
ncbi:hypothetical protein [Aminivibrio sp.]|uniref:hypothetical protein n=1 Tax=Aminivibrio sp. TaxID=1872489 RepID=UPI001A5CF82F|nr:hypothetical protein [Aminivibrio sp.]MBL3539820.1 hypothetical protein [Aminivibrio sp.]